MVAIKGVEFKVMLEDEAQDPTNSGGRYIKASCYPEYVNHQPPTAYMQPQKDLTYTQEGPNSLYAPRSPHFNPELDINASENYSGNRAQMVAAVPANSKRNTSHYVRATGRSLSKFFNSSIQPSSPVEQPPRGYSTDELQNVYQSRSAEVSNNSPAPLSYSNNDGYYAESPEEVWSSGAMSRDQRLDGVTDHFQSNQNYGGADYATRSGHPGNSYTHETEEPVQAGGQMSRLRLMFEALKREKDAARPVKQNTRAKKLLPKKYSKSRNTTK